MKDLEEQPKCRCGCETDAPVAKKTDGRSGAVRGQPQRFVRGHAARLRSRPGFTADRFWGLVDKETAAEGGCWLFPHIQVTVGRQRVYARRVAVLLDRGLEVNQKNLARLGRLGRCRRRRRCVRPDHRIVFSGVPLWCAIARMAADLKEAGGQGWPGP